VIGRHELGEGVTLLHGLQPRGDVGAPVHGIELVGDEDDRPLAAGEGRYYLVRAQNGCGSGSFGSGSSVPDPRDALDAALPPACR